MRELTIALIAEDDDDDYQFFGLAVAELPYNIKLKRAENGEKLMRLLEERVPDFLFLDILMPCKNGVLCIKEIRANPRYDEMPVIMYSSLTDMRNISLCYEYGANWFIQKPVTVPDLRDILKAIFSPGWKKANLPPLSEFIANKQILKSA